MLVLTSLPLPHRLTYRHGLLTFVGYGLDSRADCYFLVVAPLLDRFAVTAVACRLYAGCTPYTIGLPDNLPGPLDLAPLHLPSGFYRYTWTAYAYPLGVCLTCLAFADMDRNMERRLSTL